MCRCRYDRNKLAEPANMDFSKLQRVNFAFFQIDTEGNMWGVSSCINRSNHLLLLCMHNLILTFRVFFSPFLRSRPILGQTQTSYLDLTTGIPLVDQLNIVLGTRKLLIVVYLLRFIIISKVRILKKSFRSQFFDNAAAGDRPTDKVCNYHDYEKGLINLVHKAGAEIYPSIGGT